MEIPHSTDGKKPGAKLLRIIGAFKLLKGALLILAAGSVLKLRGQDLSDVALRWARLFHIAPGNKYLQAFLVKALSLGNDKLEVLAAVLAAYSAMFLVEGVGLLMMKHWAEWMTVITTSGLIPLEVFELVRRPEIWKAATLLVNLLVAIYLAARVAKERNRTRRPLTPS